MRVRPWVMPLLIVPLALLAMACAGPNQANIELRKENQKLQQQIADLQRQHDADAATIRGLKASATTVPTLPEDQLEQLYTTHGLSFGRITGGYHDPGITTGDTELKVYITPIDDEGNDFKAAGSFTIALFDLSLKDNQRIGTWKFDLNQAKACWLGQAFMYGYVLHCPWQTVPTHANLTLRTTFTDALTQRIFTDDRTVTVQPPTPPATRP